MAAHHVGGRAANRSGLFPLARFFREDVRRLGARGRIHGFRRAVSPRFESGAHLRHRPRSQKPRKYVLHGFLFYWRGFGLGLGRLELARGPVARRLRLRIAGHNFRLTCLPPRPKFPYRPGDKLCASFGRPRSGDARLNLGYTVFFRNMRRKNPMLTSRTAIPMPAA
jgi:hypothetical protein